MRSLVLLHGLARTPLSLWPVARAARRRGWHVVSIGYPSRHASVEQLAAFVAQRVPDGSFDVVTHSMGGIVLRTAVAHGLLPVERVRRAVMLAPPSRGSELADALHEWWFYRRVLGPAGQQLGTDTHSVPLALPPVPFACGVIAGRRTLIPGLGRIFGGASDGRVSVERTRLDGMADFLVVNRAHPFLMWAPEVLAAIFGFLDDGRFPRHR